MSVGNSEMKFALGRKGSEFGIGVELASRRE
jgi:hypothetical protein